LTAILLIAINGLNGSDDSSLLWERDGHDRLPTAQVLLDRIIESQLLHEWYRERTLTLIKQKSPIELLSEEEAKLTVL
jgi:hypothetical protein